MPHVWPPSDFCRQCLGMATQAHWHQTYIGPSASDIYRPIGIRHISAHRSTACPAHACRHAGTYYDSLNEALSHSAGHTQTHVRTHASIHVYANTLRSVSDEPSRSGAPSSAATCHRVYGDTEAAGSHARLKRLGATLDLNGRQQVSLVHRVARPL